MQKTGGTNARARGSFTFLTGPFTRFVRIQDQTVKKENHLATWLTQQNTNELYLDFSNNLNRFLNRF